MKFYVVGGSVRDSLLNLPIKDIDYVVVGATPTDMIDLGYKQVGADFPVFLDNNSQEFALARTERKSGKGYHNFNVDFNPNITLEEDLFRRDLTINAMAVKLEDWNKFVKTKDEKLIIDPYGGLKDLKNRILKHVSDAFAEDPVRILRVSRFVARYWEKYRFTIHHNTLELMARLVKNGEVDHLVSERVWEETKKAFMESAPWKYFSSLNTCNAAERIFSHFHLFQHEDSKPWINAVLRNRPFEERFILFTTMFNKKQIEKELTSLRAPKVLLNDCLYFNDLYNEFMNIISSNTIIDNKILYKIAMRINAWKNIERIKKMGILISMLSIPEIDDIYNSFVRLLERGSVAKFSMLTEMQKKTLKGREITEAIEELRKNIVLNGYLP